MRFIDKIIKMVRIILYKYFIKRLIIFSFEELLAARNPSAIQSYLLLITRVLFITNNQKSNPI